MSQTTRVGKNRFRLLVGVLVTLLCLLALTHQLKFRDLKSSLRLFDWKYVILGLIILAAGYGLRIFRWSFILRGMSSSVNFGQCAAPFLGSVALNNLLPFRMGDGVRAIVYPRRMGIRSSAGLSSLLLERVLDLVVLLLYFSIGVLNVGVIAVPGYILNSAYLLLSICGFLIVILLLLQHRRSRSLILRIQSGESRLAIKFSSLLLDSLDDLKSIFNFRSLLTITFLSMCVWLGESGLFYFVLRGFGLSATIPIAILVTAIVSISTMVPSLPGYVGPFDLAAFLSISILGGSAAQSASFALIAHLALWLPTTVVGLVAIGSDYRFFRGAKKELGADHMETKK